MKNLYIFLCVLCVGVLGCRKETTPGSNGTDELISITFTTPGVTATIDQSAGTVKVTIPPGTDPTQLVPVVKAAGNASATLPAGTALDFSIAQQFTITAADGTSKTYTYTPTLPVASVKDKPTAPLALGIYYAWPSAVNGSNGDINKAIAVFAQFDILVFGDQIWRTTHGDYANAKQIIAGLKAAKPTIKIYGYIDMGITTQNLSVADITAAVDGWQAMGVTGVFGHNFGSDFQVTRARQNQLIDYAHSKSLSVFANAYNPADALGGTDCHLGAGDYYLLEHLLVGPTAYNTLADFKSRGDHAYYYMKTLHIGVATTATVPSLDETSANSDQFLMGWYGTAMYNFDAYQFSDSNYSSTSSQLNYYAAPISNYGTRWKQTDWINQTATNSFSRSTDTYTLTITGDGATTGTGTAAKLN
ncbi:hypothetical protein [Mucilaginibacter sp. dw_454]|uniref:hypothetical protein n=1 Tax=Mucilaginibacter sp. dw_454 TaxID=2720079 RepID=UPI001BD4D16A|nr:hypothetical protein [Mucilaginibacter sp. dw_454]